MVRSRFTPERRAEIKQMIWDGQLHVGVAYNAGMSIHNVRAIVAGMIWHDIPWPDGSLGALSNERRDQILIIRYEKSGGKTRNYGPRSTGKVLQGHLSRRPRDPEEQLDYEIAQGLLGPEATATQVYEKSLELKEARLRTERRRRQKEEEAHQARLALAASEAPAEDLRSDEQLERIRLEQSVIKRGIVQTDVVDKLGMDWVLGLIRQAKEDRELRPKQATIPDHILVQYVAYVEQKEADNARDNTDNDKSTAKE